MTAVQDHISDVCKRCGGNRDLHVAYDTRRYSLNLPKECEAKGQCEIDLKAAIGFEVTAGVAA